MIPFFFSVFCKNIFMPFSFLSLNCRHNVAFSLYFYIHFIQHFVHARRRNRSGSEDQIYPRAIDPFIVSFRLCLRFTSHLSSTRSHSHHSIYSMYTISVLRCSNNMCNNNGNRKRKEKKNEGKNATQF